MSSKIFRAIWFVALTVFLASIIFIMGLAYSYFTSVQKKQLRAEAELAAQGVSISGKAYLEDLDLPDYRITWISSDGTVLYDNEANTASMENHMEREEIKEALANGEGEAERYSRTLAEKQFYSAKLLPDGSVLRVAVASLAIWSLLFGMLQPITFVGFLALILSYYFAYRLANRIVAPINQIDPDQPARYFDKAEYKEVEPLLRRICAQQAEIRQDQAEIERTALIRQEFSANVSHELKTPLHAISGYSELLENGMVKEEDVKPFAGKIHREASRMTKLVEDIIDLTRLDNGSSGNQTESCDLYQIAENAIDSLEVSAAEREVHLELKGTGVKMTGVPQMLYSIVYNLCDNAVKYNHPRGSVIVTVSQEDQYAVLSVKDTGIGIPMDSQDRIYERFYRVDKSRSKQAGGTGLGLSIVKHAVMLHQGSIQLTSAPEAGSEFTVRFPLH